MPDDTAKQQSANAYPIDVESGAEMARLLNQDRLLTEAMGGIFPEHDKAEIAQLHDVLDIACGPGGWVHDVAFTHPHITVMGIDISNSMIEYAQGFAKVRHLQNARFQVMNVLEPLKFADESFDLINMRTLAAVVAPEQWVPLLQECRRVLRPGGTIRMTEPEWGFTTSAALETLMDFFNKALYMKGRSFSPTGRHIGISPVMAHLLAQAGFANIQQQAHVVDYSYNTKANVGFYEDFKIGFKLVQPFIVQATNGAISADEVSRVYEQTLVEMQLENFRALWFLLTVWGQKPA